MKGDLFSRGKLGYQKGLLVGQHLNFRYIAQYTPSSYIFLSVRVTVTCVPFCSIANVSPQSDHSASTSQLFLSTIAGHLTPSAILIVLGLTLDFPT